MVNINPYSDKSREFLQNLTISAFPLHPKSKEPIPKSWQKPYKGEWPDDCNTAIVMGTPSSNLVDVDLDWPLASKLAVSVFGADNLKTMYFGRKSSRASHFLFRVAETKGKPFRTRKFLLPKAFEGMAALPDAHALCILELRGNGAYTMVPPSIHPSGEAVEWGAGSPHNPVVVEADRLVALCGRIAFLAVCAQFWPTMEGARHDAALAFAGIAKWIGLDIDVAIKIVQWCDQSEPADRERAVRSTYALDVVTSKWAKLISAFGFPIEAIRTFSAWLQLNEKDVAADAVLDDYNAKYALIRQGTKAGVLMLTETTCGGSPAHSWDIVKPSDFKLMACDKDGARAWLESPYARRYDNGFTFDPKDNSVREVFGGTTHTTQFNMWRGWPIEAEQGDWSPLREHIFEILSGGDSEVFDYIMRWAAWAVQNPDKQAETALVFSGKQGVGKGLFGRTMYKLFGAHGRQIASSQRLTDRFNKRLGNCALLFADEVFGGNDKQANSTLKALITEPTFELEGKGLDSFVMTNMLHIVMASNEDWVVPASMDDRRFFICRIDAEPRERDYYSRIFECLENDGGHAAFLYELMHMELGDWHPREMPRTAGLQDQIELSERPVNAAIRRYLQQGWIPGTHESYRRSSPNKLLYPVLRDEVRSMARFMTDAAIARQVPKGIIARIDTNCLHMKGLNPLTGDPQFERCKGFVLKPLAEARAVFDPHASWDNEIVEWVWGEFREGDVEQ